METVIEGMLRLFGSWVCTKFFDCLMDRILPPEVSFAGFGSTNSSNDRADGNRNLGYVTSLLGFGI